MVKAVFIYIEIGIFAGQDLWEKYPSSRPQTKDGSLMPLFEWYAGVCPSNPGVRDLKLRQIKSIVENFEVER